jgi:TatD DNase family protein
VPPALVDIGVNLTNKAFRNDLDEVLERAQSAGVTRMVVTGTSVTASRDAAALAATRPGLLYSTAGVHPHDAKSCDDSTIDTLRALAAAPHVVAIGECGLDYNRDFSPRPVQRLWFEAQVELACELGMPLFIHERDAAEDTRAILSRHRDRISRAVIHCYTGDGETLAGYLDLDLHIGITGWICDERRGTHLRDLVGTIPLNRLMLETDAPYLVPRSLRPKPRKGRNEPAFLPHIAETVAQCRGVSAAELMEATTATAVAFFALDDETA